MHHVAVPRFKPKDDLHKTLAKLSQQAHCLKAEDEEGKRIEEVEAQIDRAAAELWGIKAKDLESIRGAAQR